jgi:hypothetical protein
MGLGTTELLLFLLGVIGIGGGIWIIYAAQRNSKSIEEMMRTPPKPWQMTPVIWITLLVIVLSSVYYVRFGTYDRYWTDQETDISYIDTRSRWTKDYVFRKVRGKSWSAEGPFLGTGKQHGHWENVDWSDKFTVTHEFYWYGEPITEGTWHLRNSK